MSSPSSGADGGDRCQEALPVDNAKVGYLQLAVDYGGVQTGFRLRAELPVDQVSGLRDYDGSGDQGTLIAFQQRNGPGGQAGLLMAPAGVRGPCSDEGGRAVAGAQRP